MERQSLIQDFQQRLLGMLRASPAADVERNVKALLNQMFIRMDLVTREEFEVQVDLLSALRARVDELEARLADGSAAPAPPFER